MKNTAKINVDLEILEFTDLNQVVIIICFLLQLRGSCVLQLMQE